MTCETGSFPSASRLRTPAEFKQVFAASRRSSDSQFIILARPNGLGRPRLGFAIARSSVPAAVTRNRLKRIVREYFRTHQDSLGGVDLVVMAQARTDVKDVSKLRGSLARHWKKVALCAQF